MNGIPILLAVIAIVVSRPAAGNVQTCQMGDPVACPQACESGELRSCYFWGRMLSDGNNVQKDRTRAQAVFSDACRRGLGDGYNAEAVGHRDGLLGGPRDFVRSLTGFEKACDLGSTKGCVNAAKIFQDLTRDNKRAAKLYAKGCFLDGDSSEAGCIEGGRIYLEGAEGVPKDQQRAAALFTKGCAIGSPTACTSGATMGLSLAFDRSIANARYQRFCADGDVRHCQWLGAALVRGDGIRRDRVAARAPLRTACAGGVPTACSGLAELLLDPASCRSGVPPAS